MIHAVLVSEYPTETDARTELARHHSDVTDLPYLGIWVHTTPERPLVHIFSDHTVGDIETAGWSRVSQP